MKFSSLSISLLVLTTLTSLISLPIPPVSAQCVMTNIVTQTSINGSRRRSNQSNDVSQISNGGCVGNSVNGTSVQVNTGGTEQTTQRNKSSQQINGSNNSPTGVNLAPVKVKVSAPVNVYNPADKLRRR
jgi:hypothetical protein